MASPEDEAAIYLHGILEATVFEANHLHNAIHGQIMEASEKLELSLGLHDLQHSKLYTDIDIGAARVARTREIEFHPTNPVWNQSFRLYCAYSARALTFTVKNQHTIGATVLGAACILTARIASGEQLDCWVDLHGEHVHKTHKAQLHVLLRFFDVKSDPCWGAGIQLPHFNGVKPVFFPERTKCNVTLYQNSHLSNKYNPSIHFDGLHHYHPPRLWEDLYIAIRDAKHFVYVAGWSVNTEITLVRDPERMIPGARGVTIGELLKRKADEGATVLVMPWQDRTSVSFLGNAGLMKTHDEETRKYFEDTKVKCFLCPRNADKTLTAVQHIEIGAEFTHHQKTVTLDAATPGSDSRHVVSFVGGVDLCDGRYDDENHTLFRNLDTIYIHDFQQNNFANADLQHGGPREPWHDVHSKLEGPVTWDVLANFEQRWKKQAPEEMSKCLLELNPAMFPDPHSLDNKDSWNVQLFRSIDDASVVGFPSKPAEAGELGLTSGKDVTIDQSIQIGYIEAIRRAKRFIYIENQYFLGSCASWKEDQDCGCLNLVPVEIALKIASKIKQGERFAAYIMTPMWPEGEPEGDTVQAILNWNRLTMEMMYDIVTKAIDEAGLRGKVHPCDYLNFFCLGNREVQRPGEYAPPEKPDEDTDYWRAQVNRRFLIYVHAKLMIVDDEYVIVGSANLNERSLAGNRDSEIVQGSYQPAHLNGTHRHARGLVHGYRMSLWYEHFMSHVRHNRHVFLEPESLDCVRTVRQEAEKLWEMYTQDAVLDLPGHLLPFPISVSEFGELSDLPEDGCFPDTKAPVKGKKSTVLPPILTT